MKKLFAALSAILMFTAGLVCACAPQGQEKETSNVRGALVMEKKYILESTVGEEKQTYCLFHADGTGERTVHDDGSGGSFSTHRHYTVFFKYTYANAEKSAVACFYDGVTYLEGNESKVTTDFHALITVSENVLILTNTGGGISYYINEDYLGELPNYRK